jgi:RNA-binding protein 25
LKSWVNKKIAEYIGGEEETLLEFVVGKVSLHCAPQALVEDLKEVLNEDAEIFVVKLWRMLLFEVKRQELQLEIS